QAEDGIRVRNVTGVQTCALPILEIVEELAGEPVGLVGVDGCGAPVPAISLNGLATAYGTLGAGIRNIHADARVATVATAMADYRSEERRVGRESRTRCAEPQWLV